MLDILKITVEKSVFGVCHYLAQRMGVRTGRVRLYFIYLSFVTLGSPIVLYLIAAFWLNVRKYMRKSKNILFD